MSEVDISDINPEQHEGFVRWGGSPAVMLPDRSKRERYSRPSGAGKVLDDTTALEKWKIRTALLGAANDKSIIPRIVAATSKKELNELADIALDKGNASTGAEWGTALHKMTEQLDRGEKTLDDFPEEQRVRMAEYQQCLADYGLEVLADYIEVGVVNDELRFAGTADRILKATRPIIVPHGRDIKKGDLIGCDVKTNSSDLKFALLGYEVQSAIYFGKKSVLYDTEAEVRLERPKKLRADWGFIIHLPSNGEGCELVWLDLTRGWKGALLARQVKDWRNEKILIQSPARDGEGDSSKDVGNVEEPVTLPPVPVAETEQWIRDRIDVIKTDKAATDSLLLLWPKDVPGLKAGGHTDEQWAALDNVVASVEATYGLPFIPGPGQPKAPRPESSVIPDTPRKEYEPANDPDVEVIEQTLAANDVDPTAPAGPEAEQAIAERVGKLDATQRAAVATSKLSAAGTLTVAGCSILTFEHWRALLTWIENGNTVAWAAAFTMLGYDNLDITTLDYESARAMTEIGESFANGYLVVDATGTTLVPSNEMSATS